MKKICYAVAMTALIATNSMAADGMYFGAGVAQMNLVDTDGSDYGSSTLGTLTIGKDLTDNFAIEAILGTSITDASVSITETDTVNWNTSFNYTASIFALIKENITESVKAFAKLGWTKLDISIDLTYPDNPSYKYSASGDADDISYGVGMAFKVNQNSSIHVEYLKWYDKDNTTIDGFGLTYAVKY